MTNAFMIAAILFFECRGEPLEGKMAVKACIDNRDTASFLSWTRFAPWSDYNTWSVGSIGTIISKVDKRIRGIIKDNPVEYAAWQECLRIAMKPRGNLKYTHYYNPKVCTPPWDRRLVGKTVIGQHLFGKMP